MSVRESARVPSFLPFSSFLRSRGSAILLALAAILVPQVAGAGQLQLSWVDNSGGEAAFRIERKTGADGTYAELDVQSSGITSYADTSALEGTTYCYRVQAYDDAGVSGYSNEACGSVATGLVLTVSLSGTGKGSVSSSPTGVSCGTDCVETYPAGTVVTLSASTASDSTFGGWGGGCAGTDPCTLTGNAPVTVSATFAAVPPASYILSVAKSGPGTVTSGPAGIYCGWDCSESYASGTAVTLTATPSKGARFIGWSGGGCTGTGTCSVVLKAATSVSATFSKGKGGKKGP